MEAPNEEYGRNGDLRYPLSCKCVSSVSTHFNYYDPLEVEDVVDTFTEHRAVPLNGVTSDPYEFVIDPQGDTFLDMGTIYMHVNFTVKSSKSQVEMISHESANPNQQISLGNNTIQTMWDTLETKVNNVTVGPSSSYNVGYKSFFENALSYDSTKNTSVKPGNFFIKYCRQDERLTQNDKCFMKLKEVMDNQYTVELCGLVCSDFLRSDNYLAPGNRLSLTFTLSQIEKIVKCHYTQMGFFIDMNEFVVYYRRLRVYPEKLAKVWSPTTEQRYFTNYTRVQLFPMGKDILDWTVPLVSGGALPKHIIIGFVETEAANGAHNKDQYNFQPFNLSQIYLIVNGIRYPSEPLEPNFTNRQTGRTYHHLFMNTGRSKLNVGNSISKEMFDSGGLTLYAFDLSSDLCNNYHIHAGKEGKVELCLKWRTPLAKLITCVAHFTNDHIVKIPQLGAPPISFVF